MELPEGLTRDDIKDILKEWKDFETVYDDKNFPYFKDLGSDDRYGGLCEYVEKHYKVFDFYQFLLWHYDDDKIRGYLQPDTLETRIEVLEDILEKTKDD